MAQSQVPIVLAVILDDQGRMLMAKRHDEQYSGADGKWEFIGGHVEFNEDPKDAAIREAKEESGLVIEVERLLPEIYCNYWKDKTGEEVQTFLLSYVCKIVGGKLHSPPIDPKISELKFVDMEEFRTLDVLPKIKEIVSLLNL